MADQEPSSRDDDYQQRPSSSRDDSLRPSHPQQPPDDRHCRPHDRPSRPYYDRGTRHINDDSPPYPPGTSSHHDGHLGRHDYDSRGRYPPPYPYPYPYPYPQHPHPHFPHASSDVRPPSGESHKRNREWRGNRGSEGRPSTRARGRHHDQGMSGSDGYGNGMSRRNDPSLNGRMSLNGRLQSSRSGEDVLRTLEEAERDGEMVDNMNRVV